jgi:hypothetical protein
MTHVIQELSKEGIRVGYVYDALLCAPKDVHRIKEVMDYVVLRHGVKTSAKISN